MVKTQELAVRIRQLIYEMKIKTNMSNEEVAKRFRTHKNTVRDIIIKFEKYHTFENLSRSGRKRCTTDKEDRVLKRVALTNKKLTAAEI